MFFRLKSVSIILGSIFLALTSTTAQAKPAVISALTTPEMAVEMQGADPEMQKQIACTALAVYHEALNQGERGQLAVVHVILNRVKSNKFANTPCGVVFQRGQFSFVGYPWKRLIPSPSNRHWHAIVRLVQTVQSGIADPTSGAMYFYNPRLARPAWRNRSSVQIGAHVFVR